MKNIRKGQLSIIVLFGLVILVGVSLVFFIESSEELGETSEVIETEFALDPVENYLQNCLKSAAEEGFLQLGRQGMYFELPEDSQVVFSSELYPFAFEEPALEFNVDIVPYYLIENRFNVPTLDFIEEQISSITTQKFQDCVETGIISENVGFGIEIGNLTAQTDITGESILVRLNSPISLKLNNNTRTFDELLTKLDYDFIEKHSIVKEFIAAQLKDMDYFLVGYLSKLAYDNNFEFEVDYLEEGRVLFYFLFDDFLLQKNQPFVYAFLIKYPWISQQENEHFLDDYNISLTAFPGYDFYYKLEPRKEGLKFYDYSNLFDINEITGEISFTPTVNDVGKHTALVKMEDEGKGVDFVNVNLDVVEDNIDPVIKNIPDMKIKKGQNFAYKVEAEDADGDNLIFSDDTDLFDINPISGIINFIPQEEGHHKITIAVFDLNAGSDYREFYLEVEDE